MQTKYFIRQSLFFAALTLASLAPLPERFGPTLAQAEILPSIEAHEFKVTPLEKSKTGRVYRFRTNAQELPHTGNIVLIQINGKPVMAFRVLKTVAEINEFIGKRVRRYDTVGELKLNERYTSAEKLADLVSPPPADRSAYNPNAKPELGGELPPPAPVVAAPVATPVAPALPELDPLPQVAATPAEAAIPAAPPATPAAVEAAPTKTLDVESYDNDLDGSTSPQNLKKSSNMGDEEDADHLTEAKNEFEVEETAVLSPYKHMVGISLGVFRNMSNFNISNPTPNNGFTGYYSSQVDRGIYFRGKRPQDQLSLEYGFTYFTRLNANLHNDDYAQLPLRVELRYDLHLSEAFSLVGYGGLQYNLILSTQNVSASSASDVATTHKFQGFQLNVGAGFLYNIGPQWYLRGDLGLDRFAFGLAVKW